MSLATLFKLPQTPDDFSEWSFSNRDGHNIIVAAIAAKHGIHIVPYILDPITPASMQAFLLGHQAMHNQEALILGVDAQDFLTPNFADWWYDHADQHRREMAALGM